MLAILTSLQKDEDPDVRWRLAMRGIDQLLGDIGLDVQRKFRSVTSLLKGLHNEFRWNSELNRQVGEKFRAEREAFKELLACTESTAVFNHPLSTAKL